jgi:hypothetical protein
MGGRSRGSRMPMTSMATRRKKSSTMRMMRTTAISRHGVRKTQVSIESLREPIPLPRDGKTTLHLRGRFLHVHSLCFRAWT